MMYVATELIVVTHTVRVSRCDNALHGWMTHTRCSHKLAYTPHTHVRTDELQHKINRHVRVYFSMVRRRPFCACVVRVRVCVCVCCVCMYDECMCARPLSPCLHLLSCTRTHLSRQLVYFTQYYHFEANARALGIHGTRGRHSLPLLSRH